MNYPLSYSEYEKEVFKRFSKIGSNTTQEEKENIEVLNEFLETESPHFIEMSYATSCGIHDQNIERWKELGVSDEQILENFLLPPIENLEMLLCPIR